MTESRALPLEGIRVIDLTVENGELAPRLLADLGPEVIKVESRQVIATHSSAPVPLSGSGAQR